MAEYIEREAALELVQPDAPEDEKAAVTIATAKKLVRSILHRTPAADVAPVVHGRWENGCVCSVCTSHFGPKNREQAPKYRYCPFCGAKMDGGADHE